MIKFDLLNKEKERLYSQALGRRIYTEVVYLYEVAKTQGTVSDELFNAVIEKLAAEPLTLEVVESCEKLLAPLKAYDTLKEVLYVAHSHIDMNWMWGYDETVAITLATFRTTLDMMKEYPFTFGQSQASCYKIVEQYDPDMLEEIRQRIKEGRWEVTATSWVETDRNMPAQETHIRQLYFTKKYLTNLFGLEDNAFRLSYEPDTFGHNAFSPDVLSAGGVKWMYHCRGYEGEYIYRWRSRSGAEILNYREPIWYNSRIDDNDFRSNLRFYVSFAKQHGLNKVLQVYGIGDHGGGVTRGELEMIEEMKTYPLIPTVRYGTYREYFEYLDEKRESFPIVEGELNPIFDGCYTSQSRIKRAYKLAETNVMATEASNAMSVMENGKDYSERFENAWKNVMFCTFHDIIPGSNVRSSRHYAMGLLQEATAMSETARTLALRSISENIDLSAWNTYLIPDKTVDMLSDGAGVGYGGEVRATYDISRSDGKGRAYAIYNTLPFEREMCVELPVYDWKVDYSKLEAVDGNGNLCAVQILDQKPLVEWLHSYIRLVVKVKVPAMGYQTILLKEKENIYEEYNLVVNPRVQKELVISLENANVKADFQTNAYEIGSLNVNGKIVLPKGSGYFEFAKEDPHAGMTSWVVGRLYEKTPLTTDVRLKGGSLVKGGVREEFTYLTEFGRSNVEITPRLENDMLQYTVRCDWREDAEIGKSIPQLAFRLPLRENVTVTKQVNERVEESGVGFAAAHSVCVRNEDGSGFILVAKDKYGFEYKDGMLSLLLIRSSYDPDRFPEYGEYRMDFAIIPFASITEKGIDDKVREYMTPTVFASLTGRGKGNLPLSRSYYRFEANSSSIFDCCALDNCSVIVKLREWSGKNDNGILYTQRQIEKVEECDYEGKPIRLVDSNDNDVMLSVAAHGMSVYKITWRK